MNNNNNSSGQVPDPRLQQIMDQMRQLQDQNSQLRGQIEIMARGGFQQPQQQPQKQSKFSPEVESAITERVQEIVNPFIEQVKNQTGFMHDQMDQVAFMQQYGKPQYEPYLERVEQVRRNAQAQGRWIPREQALQLVYFEETGKKPAPQQVQTPAQQGPVFDAFLGQYVNSKGEIVPPPGTVDAEKLMQQTQTPPQQQQAVQQPQQQFQPQQMQQQFQQQFQNPQQQFAPNQQWVQQPQQQAPQQQGQFQLPNQSPPEQMRMTPAGAPHVQIDISSGDQALDQFEQRYGDIPL